jgi:competence protein ComEC
MSISLDRILNFSKEELIFFSIRKKSAIAYTQRAKCVVLADFDYADRTFSYSIRPGLESRGGSDITLLNIDSTIRADSYWSDTNFMQFGKFQGASMGQKNQFAEIG